MALYGLDPYTALVDAVLTRLQPLAVAQGQYVRTLKRGPGNLARMSDAAFAATIDKLSGACPAVLVTTDEVTSFDGTVGRRHSGQWWADVALHLYCANDHRRDFVVGRLEPVDRTFASAAQDPGLCVLANDVLGLLAGHAPITQAGRINPVRGETVWLDAAMSVWVWRCSVKLQLSGDVPLTPAPAITEVVAEVDVDPADITVIEENLL